MIEFWVLYEELKGLAQKSLAIDLENDFMFSGIQSFGGHDAEWMAFGDGDCFAFFYVH